MFVKFSAELRADLYRDENWIHYIDAMLQLPTLYHTENLGKLVVPMSIQEIRIDPVVLDDPVQKGWFNNAKNQYLFL